MEKEPGKPTADVVVVLVGFMVLASGAKLLMGCGLLLFGFARQQPAVLRGGALVAGALVIAG